MNRHINIFLIFILTIINSNAKSENTYLKYSPIRRCISPSVNSVVVGDSPSSIGLIFIQMDNTTTYRYSLLGTHFVEEGLNGKDCGVIYCFYCKVNNKVYVGKSKHEKNKILKRYLHEMKSGNRVINRAMRKHGFESFDFFIADKDIPMIHLDELEQLYVEFYNSNDPHFGYNVTIGGGGTSGYKRSEASKKKQSEISKLRIGTLNHFFGKHHTKESMVNVIKSNVNRRGEKRPHNQVTKDKISATKKKNGAWVGSKNPRAHHYRITFPDGTQVEFIGGISSFCKENNLKSRMLLLDVAKGKRDNYKGFKCEIIKKAKCENWHQSKKS